MIYYFFFSYFYNHQGKNWIAEEEKFQSVQSPFLMSINIMLILSQAFVKMYLLIADKFSAVT